MTCDAAVITVTPSVPPRCGFDVTTVPGMAEKTAAVPQNKSVRKARDRAAVFIFI